jgi:hypothetical protein
MLARYDPDAGRWRMTGRLFGREGRYGPWEGSESRNAYLHDVLFDARNRLHVTWIYREAGRTWASNHDLHYATSDDLGVTWRNNAGEPIADLDRGDAIVLGDPGLVVAEIPVYSWVMNQCAMALDSRGQPHVALYRMGEPFVPDEVEHNPPAAARDRLAFHHYWREPGGAWRTSDGLWNPGPDRPVRIRRPNIAIDEEDYAYVYWPAPGGFLCHAASRADGWRTWGTFPLTDARFTTNDASKHDRRLLGAEGVLSFAADPKVADGGEGYAILDFDIGRLRAAARQALEGR